MFDPHSDGIGIVSLQETQNPNIVKQKGSQIETGAYWVQFVDSVAEKRFFERIDRTHVGGLPELTPDYAKTRNQFGRDLTILIPLGDSSSPWSLDEVAASFTKVALPYDARFAASQSYPHQFYRLPVSGDGFPNLEGILEGTNIQPFKFNTNVNARKAGKPLYKRLEVLA